MFFHSQLTTSRLEKDLLPHKPNASLNTEFSLGKDLYDV